MTGGTKGSSCGGGGGAGFESVRKSQPRVSADCKARDTVFCTSCGACGAVASQAD